MVSMSSQLEVVSRVVRGGPVNISVSAGKGGVGKSTISCGLASLFSSAGYKTCLIDLDPQGDSTWGIGADPLLPGTGEFLTGQEYEVQSIRDNLDVLAGGPQMEAQEISRCDAESLYDQLGDLPYDVRVFDCPAKIPNIVRLGLVASDYALIATNAHPFSIRGSAQVLHNILSRKEKGRVGAKHIAFILSMINLSYAYDRELGDSLKESFPDIPQLTVGQDTNLKKCTAYRTPLAQFKKSSRGIDDLESIKNWIESVHINSMTDSNVTASA